MRPSVAEASARDRHEGQSLRYGALVNRCVDLGGQRLKPLLRRSYGTRFLLLPAARSVAALPCGGRRSPAHAALLRNKPNPEAAEDNATARNKGDGREAP